jgi:transglutaminase-like putative cysteine protease
MYLNPVSASLALVAAVLLSIPVAGAHVDEADVVDVSVRRGKNRAFVFHYDFRLTSLPVGESVRVWLPCPSNSDWQTARMGRIASPVAPLVTHEKTYRNRLLYFELTVPESGELLFRIPWRVERSEVRLSDLFRGTKQETPVEFLAGNAMVPIDGQFLELLDNVEPAATPLERARQYFDLVDSHVRYSKEHTGWGRGDVNWVCDSRFGNCTDFHSLFISLARSQQLPAKFEIGFPIPTDSDAGFVSGYHCWAWVQVPDRGWIPVDISEADKHPEMKDYYFGSLTADRVAFSVGRDLVLEPRQDGPPLNFLIYPYAEVDGRPLGPDNVELMFSYSKQTAARRTKHSELRSGQDRSSF